MSHPGTIGLATHDIGFDFFVVDDAALHGVHEEHPSRHQTALLANPLRVHRKHARFGRQHHQTVGGHLIAARTESVPIQRGADQLAVGKTDGRRSVPGFLHGRVVLVESTAIQVHLRIGDPGFGNQHHHRVRQRPPAEHQKFERVVQTGRIALVLVHDGKQFLHVLAEQFGVQPPLPCAHPIHIALQRVDFAVVANVAIGMGQRPGREGIRAESRVHEGQAARHAAVGQVLIVLGNLMRK